MPPIKWMSGAQVAEVLARAGVSLSNRTRTGRLSVREEVLERLEDSHSLIPLILEYRRTIKLLGMAKTLRKFCRPEGEGGVINCEWLQTGVPTGRFRSRNPNLQQIPEALRSAFIPRPGFLFLSADFDQIELRILAACSKERTLLDAFRLGQDPHAATAAMMLDVPVDQIHPEQRALGKTLNYAVLYGTGSGGLAGRLKVSRSKARELQDQYFKAVPSLTAFLEALKVRAISRGYVESYYGRRRPLPEIYSDNPKLQAFGMRSAVNGFAQSTASDIFKAAMLRLAAALPRIKARLLLVLHDAVLIEVPESVPLRAAVPLIRGVLETEIEGLLLTVTVSTGPDWSRLSKAGGL